MYKHTTEHKTFHSKPNYLVIVCLMTPKHSEETKKKEAIS